MPEIRPFAGIHYEPGRVGDLTQVMTQPYDRINDALQAEYYRRHEHSFIRIDKRKGADYAGAAAEFEAWLASGVLVQDAKPALYAYHQVYRTPSGETKTRRGVSALVKLEEPGKGRILPHEETHSGPKIDRRRLLEATRTHLSQVFLLYSDPRNVINTLLDPKGQPDLQAKDDYGETHRVWRVDDEATIADVCKAMKPKDAIIADGHHRYETAWGYHLDHPEADHVLATLINIDDEGLTIFGTHRLIRGFPTWDFDALLKKASKQFEIREFTDRKKLLAELAAIGGKRPAFGAASHDRRELYLFAVTDVKRAASQVKAKRSEAWRSLDVNLLHSVVLEGVIGITPEHTKKEMYVEYLRSADETLDRVAAGRGVQGAFLVNPVKIDPIKRIVKQGERFPQKTTDFYPKLLSGLVMARV